MLSIGFQEFRQLIDKAVTKMTAVQFQAEITGSSGTGLGEQEDLIRTHADAAAEIVFRRAASNEDNLVLL